MRGWRLVLWACTLVAVVGVPLGVWGATARPMDAAGRAVVWWVAGRVHEEWAAGLSLVGWVCAVVATVGWWVVARPGHRVARWVRRRWGDRWAAALGLLVDLVVTLVVVAAGLVLTAVVALVGLLGTWGSGDTWDEVRAPDGGRVLVQWSALSGGGYAGDPYVPDGWWRWVLLPGVRLHVASRVPPACGLGDAGPAGRVLTCPPASVRLPR